MALHDTTGSHPAFNHVVVADAVTGVAATASTFGWVMGWLPGIVSMAVGVVAIMWYTIQILDSDYYKKWRQRRHRAHVRKTKKRHG